MKRKNAFINAANGIGLCIRQEVNFRIQLIAALTAISLGFFFNVNATEWLFIIGCCMLVLSLELLNTALENICDIVSKDFDPLIKIVKDTAAGAVFLSAAGSAVMGAVIFLPKIIHQIKLLTT
ncbi:MAG: diacylglycerol kinase family protein [Ferruginibacter sp.]|nr:diacylglycerol kinase family protein [Ferruginibacter sp.]